MAVDMDKNTTKSFLNAYDMMPPRSFHEGDFSIAIRKHNGPIVVWILFNKGCAVFTFYFYAQVFDKLLESI
jgi:hypothetical protein